MWVRRTSLLLCAVVCLGAAMAAAAPGTAAQSRPTVTGPATVGYFDQVTLTGTTPSPNERVTVYLRGAQSSTYGSRIHASSDSTGRFRISYHERRTTYYYAQVGTVKSTVHVTRLVAAACTVGAPMFTKVALPGFRPRHWHYPQLSDYASLAATANGVWAGTAVTFGHSSLATIAVIRWAGGARARVLGSFAYRHEYPELGEHVASVSVAGVTHSGAVVAAVAAPSRSIGSQLFHGYVWANGKRYQLRAPSGWSVHPTGVFGLTGSVVGWVRNGPRSTATHTYAVTWRTPTSPFTKIAEIGRGYEDAVSNDDEGDVAYVDRHEHSWVHIGNADFPLTGPHGEDGEGRIFSGRGTHFYGSQYGPIVRWNVQRPSASGIRPERAIAPRDSFLWIAAIGRRGDVVTGWLARKQHLRTAWGGYVRIPAEPTLADAPETAINARGAVAFTSNQDSLVHVLRCTRRR